MTVYYVVSQGNSAVVMDETTHIKFRTDFYDDRTDPKLFEQQWGFDIRGDDREDIEETKVTSTFGCLIQVKEPQMRIG